jgi:hypothetical protein
MWVRLAAAALVAIVVLTCRVPLHAPSLGAFATTAHAGRSSRDPGETWEHAPCQK